MQYKVIGIKKSKKKYFLLIPTIAIIPFLSFFFYFLLFTQAPFVLLRSLLFDYTPKVKYETFKIYVDESVSESISESIKGGVEDIEFQGKKRFEFVEEEKSDFILGVSTSEKDSIVSKELIPVGHLYWVSGEVKDFKDTEILMEEQEYLFSYDYLSSTLGLRVRKVESLSDELQKSEKNIGMVFPSNLNREFKILKYGNNFALSNENGGIKISYSLEGDDRVSFIYSILSRNIEGFEDDVLERDAIVKVNMTGVTAMSRGLAMKMDSTKDYAYAAKDIGEFLADADLTHTSNEVSFVDGCVASSGMRFCSRPEYIETLKRSGIDIVELTGNHNNDFGSTNNTKSIETYKELGWDYFGGGLNAQDASKILYKDIKGSRIAFVGYNYYDTMLNTGAIASDNRAGANSYSVEKLGSDIKEAKESADVVIVTFQFQECYSYPPSDVIYPICYKPLSSPDQKGVFRKAVDLGADVVVGTQAHQPQTYEVYKDGVIFYGLGNLYFDQHRWIGTRQGLVLSLHILEGKLVQTELTPTIYDRDLIPRVAGKEDGNLLLNLLKSARNF